MKEDSWSSTYIKNSYLRDFLTYSSQLNAMASSNKYELYPIGSKEKQRFLKFSDSQKETINQILKFNCELYEEIDSKPEQFREKPTLAWYAISRLGVIPPENLFAHIEEGDCIEIYDSTGIQVFRDMQFCEYCQYSLAQILTHPWQELYKRDDSITNFIERAFGKSFQVRQPFDPNVPAHVVAETMMPHKAYFEVQMKCFSPLFDKSGVPRYLFATSKITPVMLPVA